MADRRNRKAPAASRWRPRRWPGGRTQFTRFLGFIFCLGGFVAILLAWNATARLSCVDCQLPYLLSGGMGGLGLILLGVGLLLVAEIRALRSRPAGSWDERDRAVKAAPGSGTPEPEADRRRVLVGSEAAQTGSNRDQPESGG